MTQLAEIDALRGMPSPGTIIGRRYRLDRAIGQGGMSAVFLAHDSRLERDVAFKILTPALAGSHELVLRFVNEARTLARLDCPHIVRVLDAGVTDEPTLARLPYMVLELLHGEDLRTRSERGMDDVSRVVGWVLQACEGLAAAHAEGVIHRDLKPENLFLCSQPDGTELVKVLDFGIARSLTAPSLTLSGAGVGSPGYMSPEQVREASVADERSDIWSLGVVLYELLAGVQPFSGGSGFEVCAAILAGQHPRLDRVCPGLPKGLAAVVERCLAVDPRARLNSVLELALGLAPFCPELGAETALRVRHRLLLPAVDALPGDASPTVDVEAPTIPAFVATTRARRGPRRRQLAAQGIAALSLATTLALLARAYAPALAVNSPRLDAAEASVTRVGERVSAVARDIWRPLAKDSGEPGSPTSKSNNQEGMQP
jgi:serine/threonine protein kinase